MKTITEQLIEAVQERDAEKAAELIMQGVLNNDEINSEDGPLLWDDACDAMEVYGECGGVEVEYGELAAAIHDKLEVMMRENGNL